MQRDGHARRRGSEAYQFSFTVTSREPLPDSSLVLFYNQASFTSKDIDKSSINQSNTNQSNQTHNQSNTNPQANKSRHENGQVEIFQQTS